MELIRAIHAGWVDASAFTDRNRRNVQHRYAAVVTTETGSGPHIDKAMSVLCDEPLAVLQASVLRTLVVESKKNGVWAGPIQDAEAFLPENL